jgi:tRNA(Ile)-lysidine synthase
VKGTSLKAAVRRALERFSLPARGQTVLAALSGGADSVALLDALVSLSREAGFVVEAAHLDHGLRPGSAEDAAFCGALSAELGVRLVSGCADVAARARQDRQGVEAAARAARYEFLRRVKGEIGAVAIAVAHTRDDQAETFLMRLLRGSGSVGLAAMRASSGDVIRPLLAVSRHEVLRHLAARGLPHREDESNRDLRYTRNRVRHELIPYLEHAFNPRVRAALARAAELVAAESDLMATRPGGLDEQQGALPLPALSGLPLAQRRIAVRRSIAGAGGLRGVAEIHLERILRLAARPDAKGHRVDLPGHREAIFEPGGLRIRPAQKESRREANA